MPSLPEKNAGEDIANAGGQQYRSYEKIKPNEDVEKVFRYLRSIFLGLPNLRMKEKGAHHQIMENEEEDPKEREAPNDEMKNGKQFEMLAIDNLLPVTNG